MTRDLEKTDSIPDLIKRLCDMSVSQTDVRFEAADALADYDKIKRKNKVLVAVLKKQDVKIEQLENIIRQEGTGHAR